MRRQKDAEWRVGQTNATSLKRFQANARFELNMLQFLQTEVGMGITFARLAFNENTEERQQRNRENARKAYDTAKYFLNKHPVEEPSVQDQLHTQMTTLRDLLRQLGERFAE